MNPQLTTLAPITSSPNTKTILAKEGFRGTLITLAPGDETPVRAAHDVEEHVLFVIAGEAAVRMGDVTTMLRTDEALLIPKGRADVIATGTSAAAKLLRVDVPPRQVITPPLVSMAR